MKFSGDWELLISQYSPLALDIPLIRICLRCFYSETSLPPLTHSIQIVSYWSAITVHCTEIHHIHLVQYCSAIHHIHLAQFCSEIFSIHLVQYCSVIHHIHLVQFCSALYLIHLVQYCSIMHHKDFLQHCHTSYTSDAIQQCICSWNLWVDLTAH